MVAILALEQAVDEEPKALSDLLTNGQLLDDQVSLVLVFIAELANSSFDTGETMDLLIQSTAQMDLVRSIAALVQHRRLEQELGLAFVQLFTRSQPDGINLAYHLLTLNDALGEVLTKSLCLASEVWAQEVAQTGRAFTGSAWAYIARRSWWLPSTITAHAAVKALGHPSSEAKESARRLKMSVEMTATMGANKFAVHLQSHLTNLVESLAHNTQSPGSWVDSPLREPTDKLTTIQHTRTKQMWSSPQLDWSSKLAAALPQAQFHELDHVASAFAAVGATSLRPLQEQLLPQVAEHQAKHILVQAPPGAGKTLVVLVCCVQEWLQSHVERALRVGTCAGRQLSQLGVPHKRARSQTRRSRRRYRCQCRA